MPSPICPAVGAARHPEGRAEQGDMMPLFGKPADGAGSAWEPEAAEGRLAHTFGADPTGVFTSDLSVSEYVLLGEAGFEPLGFVIGSSIYHIGLQIGKWSQNQELQVLTQAMYNARELAMTRMQAEAEHLGADGTVGVELRMQAYVWGQDVLEFIRDGNRRQGDRQLFAGRTELPTAARSPRICRSRTSSASWPPARSRWLSSSGPACTTSRINRPSRRCVRPVRTRR